MNTHFRVIFLSLYIVISGCGDTSSSNSLLSLDSEQPIEAFIINQNSIELIETSNTHYGGTRTQPTVSKKLDKISSITSLDTDLLSESEADTETPDDRLIFPEYFAYTKLDEPSKIYLFETSSRSEQMLYDLNSSISITPNTIICSIKQADDLRDEQRKQIFGINIVTSPSNCSTIDERNVYRIEISPIDESEYRLKQHVKVRAEVDDGFGGTVTEYSYELKDVTYQLYKGQRTSIDNSFVENSYSLNFEDLETYGVFTVDKVDQNSNTIAVNFYQQDAPDQDLLLLSWEVKLNADTPSSSQLVALNLDNPNTEDIYLTLDNELFFITISDIFRIENKISRELSLTTPIYTWSNQSNFEQATFKLGYQNRIAFFDGLTLNTFDTNTKQISTITSFINIDRTYSLIESTEDVLLIVEQHDSGEKNLSYFDVNLGSILIQPWVEQLISYPYQNYYDFYQNDVNLNINGRFAQTHTSGTPNFSPALENSAWLSLKNYREDDIQQFILASNDTSDGILRSPNIYLFDENAPNGQGEFRGAVFGDFATVEEAAVIGERFGMIWVKETFAEDAPLVAYYFNPSDDAWNFTKMSDDTDFPDWLPYIEP